MKAKVMRVSNSLCVALLPFTLLAACAGEVEGDASSNREAQVPADEQPADEERVDEEPADEQPADEQPADEEPADEEPADEEPADEEPADEEPVDGEPVDEEPVDEEPVDEEPVDEEPIDEEPAACETAGETRACTTPSGEAGMALCRANPSHDYRLTFTECAAADCTPGEVASCGLDDEFAGLTRSCGLYDGRWTWDPYGCNTPLVLSFDNAPVEFTQAAGWFDLVGAGLSLNHDWVSAKTPWLVLDKNDNGSIDDGRELFGSMTVLASGARASNGFVALAELDADGDGRVSSSDAKFTRLALWRDRNQDRTAAPDELEPLAASGVTALFLDYTSRGGCTGTACEVERARFEYTDAAGNAQSGTTIDVHFRAY